VHSGSQHIGAAFGLRSIFIRFGPLTARLTLVCVLMLLTSLAPRLECRARRDAVDYGAGLIVNVPFPEEEVVQALQDVVQNGIIRGSKEYNKDEYISGATVATKSRLFPAWTGGGKVFYKVRLHALDPRNFKDSGDTGTLAVRYVVTSQDEESTVLRINAVFAEDFRHAVHPSNGSVEAAEYRDIHDHIEAIESLKQQTAEAAKEKEDVGRRTGFLTASLGETQAAASQSAIGNQGKEGDGPAAHITDASPKTLEQEVAEVRRQVERRVRATGTALRSAPFHTAATLQSLPSGTEVLIQISTPYWYGVETHDGKHGWVYRDDLEELP
jgi:hypothetical protein